MDTITPVARAAYQPPKYRQRYAGVPAAPCPELKRRIDADLGRIRQLAAKGFWTRASQVFQQLREHALDSQPCTIDPHEVAIADTTIDARLAGLLAELGVCVVGQLANVPRSEFANVGIGPRRLERLEQVARRYGVRLRGR